MSDVRNCVATLTAVAGVRKGGRDHGARLQRRMRRGRKVITIGPRLEEPDERAARTLYCTDLVVLATVGMGVNPENAVGTR